ncbi:MAG: HAMP domain-containing sensor histidine kinase [Xanthobacteraceae bacterium]
MTAGSLRLRLFLAGVVAVLVALGLSWFGLTLLFERHAERRMASDLAVVVDDLVNGLDRDAEGKLTVVDEPGDSRFERPLSGLYWEVMREPAGVIARSRSLWDTDLTLPADELSEGTLHQHRIAGPGGTSLLAVERRVILPPRLGGEAVRVAVARDAADLAQATHTFTADLAPYLALIALLLIGAFGAQVAVGLAPLKAMRARLAAIRSGKAERLGSAFPDEVQPLAGEIDALLDAREQQVAAARARAADLAHGLKTPLQVLAGCVERLKAGRENEIAGDLASIGEAMRRHVERELARARRGAAPADPAAPVRAIVERVVAVVGRTPKGATLDWAIDASSGLAARIPPDELTEVIGNLLENAARHANERVAVNAKATDGEALIAVVDDGPGIPPDHVAEVLQRGRQLDQGGAGAGLGLAIVADILEAWGGSLSLGPTAPGAMTATVRLPLTAR